MAQEIRIQANGKNQAKNLSFLFNGKRGSKVANKKTKKKKSTHHRNPFRGKGRGKSYKSHHRNPFREKRGGKGGTVETVLGTVSAVVLPELIEGMSFFASWNSGIMGYVLDVVIGGGIMYAGGKFVGRGFSDGALGGITAKLSFRAMQDIGTSPANAIHANVRDAIAQASQTQGQQQPPANAPMSGVGRPSTWNFPVPASYKLGPGGFAQTVSLSGMGRGVPTRQLRRRVA